MSISGPQSFGLGTRPGDHYLNVSYANVADVVNTNHVCVGDFQTEQLPRCPERAHFIQMQCLASETIDQVAQTLPCHHLDEGVTHEISILGIDIAILDIR